ncbi:MAG TPA: PilZ domain-containing protein [Clostridia bacterium]|nr:PilZ domain-containing protein [Clostridia bacterium]
MKTNIMVIGNIKEEAQRSIQDAVQDAAQDAGREIVNESPVNETTVALNEPSRHEPVLLKDWGNEHAVLSRLDGKVLADRRLYARVLYMHKIWCSTLFESLDSGPTRLMDPMEFTVVDVSMGGIGIVCDYGIPVGTVLSFKLPLDNIMYDVKCEVVYCFENSDSFRAGLKLVERDKNFIRHLKIFVARLTLQSMLGTGA